jgi:hypothetical protein
VTVAHESDGFYRTECGLFMGFEWEKRPDVYVRVRGRMPSWARPCQRCAERQSAQEGK